MHTQYFVAIVEDGVPFDPVAHRRLDLDPDEVTIIFAAEAGRSIIAIVTDAQDPGLIKLRQNSWLHVSRELADGSLFHCGQGYVDVETIQSIDEDLVSVEVLCSPRDWQPRVLAALQPLKVLPAYDPVLIPLDGRDDPVEILDSWAREVFCHPSTHVFNTVDILGVDLPLVTIADPDTPGPMPSAATKPISRVDVDVTVEWTVRDFGKFFVEDVIKTSFPGNVVSSLTPDAFESSWFRVGDTVAGDSGYVIGKSVIRRLEADEIPIGFEATMGPVKGSAGIYNYVDDPDLTEKIANEFNLERAYFDIDLELNWSIEQKYVETVRFSVVNGAPSAVTGSVEVLSLQGEDVSLDSTTLLWQPATAYAVGNVRRVGSVNWRCDVAHVSGQNFAADLFRANGNGGYGQRWTSVAGDASPIGSRTATTYFGQARGVSTIMSAALRARAMIAASQRSRPFEIETELTDELLSLTPAHRVAVPAPGQPGGWIYGKVDDVEISSTADDEFLRLTIIPACGSGAAAPSAAHTHSQTGQPWDVLAISAVTGQPTPMPLPGGTVVVDYDPEQQLAHVAANDFNPAAGRDDEEVNDPESLLKEVPTEVRFVLNTLAGREEIRREIELQVAPWSGPNQYGAPT